MWLVGIIAPWPLVSRYSKNVFFDGMIYDTVMFLTYTIIIGFLTEGFFKFSEIQWIGFFMVMAGFFIMKYA